MEQKVSVTSDVKNITKVVHAVQSDTGRKLLIAVDRTDLTTTFVYNLVAKKPSGLSEYIPASYNASTKYVEATMTNQLLAEVGNVKAQLEITDTAGRVTSYFFYIAVDEAMRDDSTIESSNEFTALQSMINGIAVVKAEFDAAMSAVSTDTELTNIRVKADGTTATTAGNAVREQITELKDDLTELDSRLSESITEISENYYEAEKLTNREDGTSVNYLGVKLTGLGAFASYTVQCAVGDIFYYSGKLLGSAGIARSAFFNGDAFVSYDVKSTSSAIVYTNEKIVIPNGVNKVVFSAYTADTPFEVIALKKKRVTKNDYEFVGTNGFNGHSELPKFNTDYSHIICYGQSLSNGSDSLYVPDEQIKGNYMLGAIDNPSATLNPITASQQHPVISAINSLSTLVRKYHKKNVEFICGSFGIGGQSIAQLMSTSRQSEIKAEEGYTYNIDTNGRYQAFLNSLTYGKQVADSNEKTISCPAIIFLQGERDYYSDETIPTQPGSEVHAYACGGDKDKYKLYMKRLKEDMQIAVMTTYEQAEKPLFFIYEVSGGFIKNERMTINMAQIEFAEENDDVILLPAPYFTPNYNSSHLATNGYRWFGEYIAKAIFDKMLRNEEHNVLKPVGCYVEGKNIHIKIDGVEGGLTLDNYTVEQSNDSGFNLILNESTFVSRCTPRVYGDEIIVEAPIDISGSNYTSIEIVYAGIRSNGTGNVRDNTKYSAMYDYWDDTNDRGSSNTLTISHRPTDKNGDSVIGEKYPMNKWLVPFCLKVR